ncbi:hypothetical protein [Algoriphagus namhaensis]
MNPMLQYDVARLQAFQNNHAVCQSIQVSEVDELTILKFEPVKYFNYAMGRIHTNEVLDWVQDYYRQTGVTQHQFLIDAEDLQSRSILDHSDKYQRHTKIALMKLDPAAPHLHFEQKDLGLHRVTHETIRQFAWLYLEAFEAENRHAESVEDNFEKKLEIPGLEFYFVKEQEQPVGVTGIFQRETFQILSVGAILPAFRNRGFHKAALSQRMDRCKQTAPGIPIFSWAYHGSVSHQNMIKTGMELAQEVLVYRHAQ